MVLAFAVLALLASGCGGGGDASSLSKAEFISQGNAICMQSYEKRNSDYQAYVQSQESALGPEEIVTMFVLPSLSEAAEQLGELGAPAGNEKRVQAIVAGIEKAVKRSEAQIEKNPEGFEALLLPTAELAGEYGMKNCAEVLSK